MSKTIRKLRPSDNWRIGEHESWLVDMARQGLHLKKLGKMFGYFIQGEPKQMRYRMDVTSTNNEMTLDQKQFYAESGWDYVTGFGGFHVFSSPVERNAPELHTDPAEQAFTLKDLDKKFAKSALILVLAVLFMVVIYCFVWFLEPDLTLALVEGRTIQQALIVLINLYLVYTSLQAALSIRKLRKTLAEGNPIDHHAPWQKRQRIDKIISILLIIIAIFGSVLPFM